MVYCRFLTRKPSISYSLPLIVYTLSNPFCVPYTP
nr:MAG TPA: hypothetical protein [Caudoviricetes sp.]